MRIALLLLGALTATAHAQLPGRRALPLNRFEISRLVPTRGGAFYHMPAGIADDYFDGTSDRARVQRHLRIAQEVGAKYLRCAFSWNAIEKSPGKYEWGFWDMLVDEAKRAGVELLPYVAYTPKWAAVKQEGFWAQPPRDPKLYADFMYQIVARYKGSIKAWEIWNEPDNREYWQGTVSGYAELVRQAATAMRRADPAVVLVLGGMSRGPGPFFRSLLTDHHIGGYVDVIAMHAYAETWDEERAEVVYQDWVSQMSKLIDEKGDGDDLWINEMGYSDYRFRPNRASPFGITVLYDYEHTAEYQAKFLFKTEVMSEASPHVSLTVWYRIDDFSPATTHFSNDEANYHLGLVDADGRAKPAFYALKFFNQLFGEPVVAVRLAAELTAKSQSVLESFRSSDGKLTVVGWLRSSTPGEVSDHSGTLKDARREALSIELPCKNKPQLSTYDVEGQRNRSTARITGNRLKLSLRGNDVFVGVITCKN